MEQEQKTEQLAPGARNASWGAIISIVVILAMIVIGAFYAWGKRVDEEKAETMPTNSTTTVQNQ